MKVMMLVMNGEGGSIWLATMIWYTCFVIPFRHIKQRLLLLANFLYDDSKEEDEVVVIDNLINYSRERRSMSVGEGRFEEMEGCDEVEMCSICLVDLEKQDLVSQVSRCKHAFHSECIAKWIERDEFTCPLCRSPL